MSLVCILAAQLSTAWTRASYLCRTCSSLRLFPITPYQLQKHLEKISCHAQSMAYHVRLSVPRISVKQTEYSQKAPKCFNGGELNLTAKHLGGIKNDTRPIIPRYRKHRKMLLKPGDYRQEKQAIALAWLRWNRSGSQSRREIRYRLITRFAYIGISGLLNQYYAAFVVHCWPVI